MSVKVCSATWTNIQTKCCKDWSYCTEWQSSELGDQLTIFDFRLPAQVFGTFRDGHFDTFLLQLEEKENGQKYGDEGQPIVVANRLKKCSMCYSWNSSPKQSKNNMSGCSIAVLNLLTKSLISSVWCVKSNLLVWQVWINTKTKGGHNARKTAALVGSSEPPKKRRRKTKQLTINEMLRQHQSQVDLEDDINSDEETSWIAANCRFNSFNNVVINWISYE